MKIHTYIYILKTLKLALGIVFDYFVCFDSVLWEMSNENAKHAKNENATWWFCSMCISTKDLKTISLGQNFID